MVTIQANRNTTLKRKQDASFCTKLNFAQRNHLKFHAPELRSLYLGRWLICDSRCHAAGSTAMGELESHTGRSLCPGRCPAQQHVRLLIISEIHVLSSQTTEFRAHPACQFTTTFTSRYIAWRDKDGKFAGHLVFFSLLCNRLKKFAIVLSQQKKKKNIN